MFYFDIINNKKVLKSDLLNEAEHFFTTKESFIKTKDPNLANKTEENKKDILNFLGIGDIICPKQTHSDNIAFLDDKKDFPDTDALILNVKNRAIYLNFADCTPVILYDRKQNIGAIAHAGWRGCAESIAKKTFYKMNSNPKDVVALIGPCICFKCFETSPEVISKLKETLKDSGGLFSDRYADLARINERQLRECGIEKTDVCPYCTCCNNDLLFSYRKENKTTNRISAVLKLK